MGISDYGDLFIYLFIYDFGKSLGFRELAGHKCSFLHVSQQRCSYRLNGSCLLCLGLIHLHKLCIWGKEKHSPSSAAAVLRPQGNRQCALLPHTAGTNERRPPGTEEAGRSVHCLGAAAGPAPHTAGRLHRAGHRCPP